MSHLPFDRRLRIIRFIRPWAADAHYRRLYQPRVGMPGLGFDLSLDDLADAALERLANLIVQDFWMRRRLQRQNREIHRRSM